MKSGLGPIHPGLLSGVCAAVILFAACSTAARADVTVQQTTALDVASMIRMHGSGTVSVTADKQRDDTESHCEGVMSLFCGNVQSADIVRLDKSVTWHLEPSKKRYREQPFATPEEMAAMRAKMQANLEKMRSCPVSQKQQPIDKSKCEMSPPKFDVRKTDEKAAFAGHEAQRTLATMTETCTNKETGDVCDTVVAFDVWLTQEKLPGSADRHAFNAAYAKKLGLDDPQGLMRGEVMKFLAPYQSQIKQLTDKSNDLKGTPLKTTLRVMMGGPQCSATAKAKAEESSGADTSPTNANPITNVAQAGKAIGASVGHLVGGLFHKKKGDDSPDASTQTTTAAPSAATPADTSPDPIFAKYLQMAAYSVETTNINTDPIPATRFDVPPEWTKETPAPAKGGDEKEFTCPKT